MNAGLYDSFLSFSLNVTSAEGIFSYIAAISTVFAVLLTVFSLVFGGDHDIGGSDMDHAGDSDMGIFSLRSVTGFFLGFGWAGLICAGSGLSLAVTLVVSVAVGLATFGVIAVLMRFIYGLRSDGTLKYDSLVGRDGAVYVTIPPAGQSGGQVRVPHTSQLLFLPAVQAGDAPLPANTPVVVVEVNAGILTVKPR